MNESKRVGHDAETENAGNSTSPTPDDDEFELTTEMMIHDFDDETTLNEDEEDIDTNEDELADLAKEGDMPLEDLIALYYGGNAGGGNKEFGDGEEDSKKGGTTRRSLRSTGTSVISNLDASDSDTDDNEGKPTLADDARKMPRIGDEYQVAKIPDARPDKLEKHNNFDLLVWTPHKISEDSVVAYLKKVAIEGCSNVTPEDVDAATFVQDNEDALYFLVQCENNLEDALGLYKAHLSPLNNEIPAWSEEECQRFEDGLAIFGKDFYMIHLNHVQTRSVREIIRFYYMWKKSERFDQFTTRARLGKKKEFLPANVTDYMKKLLDETEKGCTASIMHHSGANYLKYSAHSVALAEHLKQFAQHNTSGEEDTITVENTLLLGTNDDDSTSPLPKEMAGNMTDNSNMQANLKEQDLSQLIGDLIKNSSESV